MTKNMMYFTNVYYDDLGNSSEFLGDFIDKYDFDYNCETGLYGVKKKYKDIDIDISGNKNRKNIKEISTDIKNTIKKGIKDNWNPKDTHIMYASAGKDSRILMHIIKELWDEYGDSWIGNFKMICHEELANNRNSENTSTLFRRSASNIGFKKDMYHIHNGTNGMHKPDYFDYTPDFHPNSFMSYGLHYLSEVDFDLDESVWISGMMGGELLTRTYRNRMGKRIIPALKHGIYRCGLNLTQYNAHFKDILCPYLFKDYLKIVDTIHDSVFRVDDPIRDFIIRQIYNDRVNAYTSHNYNFKISNKRYKEMVNFYKNSKFYNKYKEFDKVKNATRFRGWFKNKALLDDTNHIDDKIFGMSTVYEKYI